MSPAAIIGLALPIITYVAGTIIWAVRQEGRINVLNAQLQLLSGEWERVLAGVGRNMERMESKVDALTMHLMGRK